MSKALLVGPENGIGDALEAEGMVVVRIDGTGTRPDLEDAGIADGDLLVVTDVGLTTTIPIAKELADVKVLVYSSDSVPEFVRGKQALIIDPALIDAATVAEELVE